MGALPKFNFIIIPFMVKFYNNLSHCGGEKWQQSNLALFIKILNLLML
jgi:hypothetical protein